MASRDLLEYWWWMATAFNGLVTRVGKDVGVVDEGT